MFVSNKHLYPLFDQNALIISPFTIEYEINTQIEINREILTSALFIYPLKKGNFKKMKQYLSNFSNGNCQWQYNGN